MSQKTEKPTLSGTRIKTRKRDEKEKYDPVGFRDSVLAGFAEAGDDLESIYKYLDAAGSKLDYRRYGEALFDILIAGGLLAPGGTLVQDGPGKLCKTETCLFGGPDTMEHVKGWEQVFTKLMRRYKYLEKLLEEEMKKVLVYIKGFNDSERTKLARMTALWISNGSVPPAVLNSLINEHLVKDGLALDFLLTVFVTWKQEKGASSLTTALRKAGIDSSLPEFFPPNKRTEDNFKLVFEEKGLMEVLRYQKAQANQGNKKDLQKQLEEDINDNKPVKDIVASVKEAVVKFNLQEHEIITSLWNTVMGAVEWNKKEELVAEQALKHLRQYAPLFSSFTQTPRSELALLVRVQEFCYENMNFMKVFQKIVLLFYKTDVLSEDTIIKWYKEAHSVKGKSVFLEQMSKFIEWLQSAEEESESGGDED